MTIAQLRSIKHVPEVVILHLLFYLFEYGSSLFSLSSRQARSSVEKQSLYELCIGKRYFTAIEVAENLMLFFVVTNYFIPYNLKRLVFLAFFK